MKLLNKFALWLYWRTLSSRVGWGEVDGILLRDMQAGDVFIVERDLLQMREHIIL